LTTTENTAAAPIDPNAPTSADGESPGATDDRIDSFPLALSSGEAVDRLTAMSKRGKLAGFERGEKVPAGADAAFAAQGTPFEGMVLMRLAGGRAVFDLWMPRKWAAITAAVLVVTVWPGLPLTDAFLQSLMWYERLMGGWFTTWMWYLPLTVLPAPFMLRSVLAKSRATSMEHAKETVSRVRVVLEGGAG
jgi:hypothetical protein